MDGISRYTMFVYGNPSFDCLGLPSISYYLALWTGIALISVSSPSRFASEQSVYCVLIPSFYTFLIFITIWTQIPSHYRMYSVCLCVQSMIILHTLTFLSVYSVWTQIPSHTRSFQKVFCVQILSILYTIVFFLISLFWTQIRCLGIPKLGGICVH
jgi:hypothetical protein